MTDYVSKLCKENVFNFTFSVYFLNVLTIASWKRFTAIPIVQLSFLFS